LPSMPTVSVLGTLIVEAGFMSLQETPKRTVPPCLTALTKALG
jgi:hypothetical protein